MPAYEYQVIPAPAKGAKVKGVRSAEMRFSLTLQDLMNEMGAEGWEYQRAETLPSLERSGLTGSSTNWRHVLVFRREVAFETEVDLEDYAQVSAPDLAAEEAVDDIPEETVEEVHESIPEIDPNRPPLVAERGT